MTLAPSIALISKEVWPFVPGGGLGRSVWGSAHLLSERAQVTVVTSDQFRSHYEQLVAARDERLPAGVSFFFVSEPDGDLSPFASWLQAWSARLLQAMIELYPDGGPDLVEVADYQGEGFAIAHALRSRDPRLRRTRLAVRLHTTAEMVAALDERPESLELRLLRGIERFPLAYSDILLEPGGNVMNRYEATYGSGGLAPSIRCPPVVSPALLPAARPDPPAAEGELKVLYVNRLQRLKGIVELLEAVRILDSNEIRLTVVGGDTETGPGGCSMRQHAERVAQGDARVRFVGRVRHNEIGDLIGNHHLVVVPSRWEAFSYVVREALACNRPVLATRVGAVTEAVEPGRSGWLARSSAPKDLAAELASILRSRESLDHMIQRRLPREKLEEISNEEEVLSGYLDLVARPLPRSSDLAMPWPRVTAVVPVQPDGPRPGSTIRSLVDQRGARVEVMLMTGPGSLEPSPFELSHVAEVIAWDAVSDGRPGAWVAAARRLSDELLLLLPCGAELSPDFTRRAAAALEREPGFAYATAPMIRGRESWHAPAGNFNMPAELDLGGTVALIRREALLELPARGAAPADEAALFEALAARGSFGVVLREPLVRRLPRRSVAGLVLR